MLYEFSAVKIDSKRPDVPPAAGRPAAASTSSQEPKLEDILSDDEFAKQLQAGMADLLGEMENSVCYVTPRN
jgi:peroxin-19